MLKWFIAGLEQKLAIDIVEVVYRSLYHLTLMVAVRTRESYFRIYVGNYDTHNCNKEFFSIIGTNDS